MSPVFRSSSFRPSPWPSRPSGFSLVEILVVMAVAAMIISVAGFGLKNSWRSQQVAASAASLVQGFSLARTTAMRENRPVQVRIYKFQDGDLATAEPHYRAWQLIGLNPGLTGDALNIITELQRFEGTTVMSPHKQFSSLIVGQTGLPTDETYQYVAVEFRPNGSTQLEVDPDQPWTITLLNEVDATSNTELPKDARTLVITPETGMTSIY